jgi:hypothetical protein
MSENEKETAGAQGYDPTQDPDSDPEMLTSHELAHQPDQAEGEDEDETL